MTIDNGRIPSGPGSREPSQQAVSALTGFDPSRERVHDFRKSYWGHAIHMPRIEVRSVEPVWWRKLLGAKPQQFQYLTCMGHSTPKAYEGDILLIPMKSGKTARWRIIETKWISDPDDMFHVTRADFDGYLESDSDGSPKGGDAEGGSVEDDSAGPKDIAQ